MIKARSLFMGGILILITAMLLLASGCGGQASNKGDESPGNGNGGEEAVVKTVQGSDGAYMCKMHEDERSDDPNAICAQCGMKVVPVEENEEDEEVQPGDQEHEQEWDEHENGNGEEGEHPTGHQPGTGG